MTKVLNKLKNEIDHNNIPRHVAIIMDGNGRWAKQRLLPRTAGHNEGLKRVQEIVEVAADIGVKCLSLYAFSTENWKRPDKEIDNLMKLLNHYIKTELKRIHENNVKIQTMGDISMLPESSKKEVERAKLLTKNNNKMILNIGLNYGGRHEIIQAIKDIIEEINKGNLGKEDIDEDLISNFLYTRGIPDPDLLIRPSGELRLSNFMLYQIAYTEFWFSNILWPDFKEADFYRAIIEYQKRDRRFGGI